MKYKTVEMYFNFLIAVILTFSCNSKSSSFQSSLNPINSKASSFDHSIWDALLQKYVDDLGNVDYQGFITEKDQFQKYLDYLTANKVSKTAPENVRIAYWINVYNAFTVKLVIDNYPLKSIKDIKSGIPFINDVWAMDFIDFGNGDVISLNKVEHGTLRKYFEEPRIHFAVNCASYSCPRLFNRAFTADNLEDNLNFLAKDFILDKRKNDISDPKNIKLSKIFSWYRWDFKKDGKTVIDFINQYLETKIDNAAQVNYVDYNWELNE